MDINFTLIVEMIIFMSFIYLTMKFIWPPINAALDERRLQIEDGLRQAEEGKKMLVDSEQSSNAMLEKAKEDANQIIQNADTQASSLLKASKEEALTEKQRIIESAKNDIDQYVLSKSDEISNEIVRVALHTSEKLLGEKMDTEKDIQLIKKLTEEQHAQAD